ncbi:cytochrome c biogenesis CcdA family protein [Bacillus coreaensis]
MLGREIQAELTGYFQWFRKIIGPLFIFVGLFMLQVFRFPSPLPLFEQPKQLFKKGKWGSFLMGVSFSLGFYPTMFVLFFITLMPIALSTTFGGVLPGIFAIGTTIPLLIVLVLIWYYGASGIFMKRGRKIGNIVQKAAGVIFLVVGILDTITYWNI